MIERPGDSEVRELYRAVILDHARNPRHFGRVPNPTHTAEGINPVCGDKLRLFLEVRSDTIDDARFEGTGCAISLASASLMAERIIGRSVAEATRDAAAVDLSLHGNSVDALPGDLEALKGVRGYPSRVKCATLAWRALDAAIAVNGVVVKTE